MNAHPHRSASRTPYRLCLVMASVLLLAAQGNKGKMKITVTNIEEAKGRLLVAVVNNAADWLTTEKDKPPFSSAIHVVRTLDDAVVVIDDLPAGSYGVSVFQDLNGDSKLDTNFIGYPKEPFGFSAPMGLFGPPSFAEAKIVVREGGAAVRIELQ
jgi:uncharacterized protein (DUF2141 family)